MASSAYVSPVTFIPPPKASILLVLTSLLALLEQLSHSDTLVQADDAMSSLMEKITMFKVLDLDIPRKRKTNLEKNKTRQYRVHTKEELRPYRHFTKIIGEMKYARKFPQQSKSFLDLPAELRIKIYRSAFIFEEPIEFWAQSSNIGHSYWVRQDNKKWLLRLIKLRLLNLGFLRTCRTIQNEGSQVFYGENTFRFTAVNGHIVADFFIRKIYKQHFQFITTLTIPMPFQTQGSHLWSSRTRTYHSVVLDMPSRRWADKQYGYTDTFEHLVWNLNRIRVFAKLVLVLHEQDNVETNEQGRDCKAWTALRELVTAKPALEIEIVRMCPRQVIWYLKEEMSEAEAWRSFGFPDTHAWLIRKFKALVNVCTVKAAYEHRRGRWRLSKIFPRRLFCHRV